jgi:HYDIN/CFA65/VesB family protein/flagellar associated PapD-like protein
MRFVPITAALLLCLPLPLSWSQQLSCQPCNHAFGKVKVGTSVSFSIQLSNTGSKALRIFTKSKQGSGEFHFGSFFLPVTLMPGKSVKLPIIFKPTAIGHVTGAFILNSNARNPVLSLPVAGTGAPQLTLSPTSLNFGNVTVGNSTALPIKLIASAGDVTISSDQFTNSEFSLVGLVPPVTIPSGASIQVKVKFTPGQSGAASGKAGFFGNAVPSPAVELLTGTGVAQSAHNVTLTWQSSGSAIVGFNVYRGAAHGGPYHKINNVLEASTNYVDYSVSSGSTYFYVTTAVNSSGAESGYSNETKALIPSP